jgi:hypothetical protein
VPAAEVRSCAGKLEGLPKKSGAHTAPHTFAPTAGAIFQRIHGDEHYVELEGVFIGLELERHEQSLLRAD